MNKQTAYQVLGAIAFVIGGAIARIATMENAEKLEGMIPRRPEPSGHNPNMPTDS